MQLSVSGLPIFQEEPATPGNYSKEALEYFQKKKSIFTTRWIFRFRPEEVVYAERFLDEKLPEIRQLYRMNLEESNATTLTESNFDAIWPVYMQITDQLYKIATSIFPRSWSNIARSQETHSN